MPQTRLLPDGAQALLIALATPVNDRQTGIPVLLWGRPGVGKSSFIEALAREDVRVTTLIASIHDPTDFSGLPVLEDGRVRYAAPRWVDDFHAEQDGILFLDELSTAPPSVQSALLRVVFERRVGFHQLPDRVRIVAAANPPDLTVGGWELSPPLRNRFVHLDWSISADLFVHALTNGWERGEIPSIDPAAHAKVLADWKVRIAGYLRLTPGSLHADPETNEYGFASPRSWDYSATLLATADLLGNKLAENDRTAFSLVKGCLGQDIALTFTEYIRNLRLPDPEAVLRGEVSLDVTELNDSEVYVLFASLNNYLRRAMDGAQILPYTAVYLDLISQAFDDRRRDVVFVPLKEIAQAGLLMRVAPVAAEAGEAGQRVLERINRFFSDEGLNEFIRVLS